MLAHLDILQIYRDGESITASKAKRFAACIAARLGANLFVLGTSPDIGGFGFYDEAETQVAEADLETWKHKVGKGSRHKIIIDNEHDQDTDDPMTSDISKVNLHLENWETEETLFASSGIADLLGDPAREPLIPAANYAAHSIGYAIFAAISAISIANIRTNQLESATVHGAGVLTWVNWKAAIAGSFGREITREGPQAEWPVLPCKDGYVAFLYNERDWPQVVEMVNDPALENPAFKSFKGRQADREGYMLPIRNWCKTHSKADLKAKFEDFGIPGSPVDTIKDLLSDPLMAHRKVFEISPQQTQVPKLPHRILREEKSASGCTLSSTDNLPLSGLRVLDLGIITAGAGVSALLADMGAEVVKVESETYPDPFRAWAGATANDSPFFKSNNRNKLGVTIDLKTAEGKQRFLDLVKSADIVLENFRRGVLDRLGMTFDVLRAQNPNILLASISGQGTDGPGANHTTFGSTLEASSGFASLTQYNDNTPVISGRNLNYPDQIVCIYGAALVANAAIECQRHGNAKHIDISQRDCALYQIGDVVAAVSSGIADNADTIRENIRAPGFSAVLRCTDDVYVALTFANTDQDVQIPGHGPLKTQDLAQWAATLPSHEVTALVLQAGGGASICRKGSQFHDDPEIRRAQVLETSPNGALVKGFPFQLTGTPMSIWGNSPLLGEHTSIILKQKS